MTERIEVDTALHAAADRWQCNPEDKREYFDVIVDAVMELTAVQHVHRFTVAVQYHLAIDEKLAAAGFPFAYTVVVTRLRCESCPEEVRRG